MSDFVKPTIPAEVADAIEWLRNPIHGERGWNNDEIIRMVLSDCAPCNHHEAALKCFTFDTLLAALVNGYERELTEEERARAKIREEYRNAWLDGRVGDEQADGFAQGVEFTLHTLGIRIEGVSA
ncbi:hypothetical protein P4H42_03825 [Paenibacillus macerans]|uniref:hypothetical protein n=1 Tax=Paenibacillus macerans TaxID=44252 RepID=UPI002DBF8A51|nr:hypothetical protein [Paenibacillus macerans]MEC0328752.1 hypothetical protein [Paenibacillus macerans]